MIKRFYPFLFISIVCFVISLPLILPYFHTGYFPTHDGEWAVIRLGDMFRSLRDHQFPVRYSGNLNFGYGYPLFNFTYPAPYYLGIIFHFLKFGFVDTIKVIFASSVVISALGMFLLSTRVWGNKIAGIISAVLYLYLPYRIVDLYARGSIGESMALALFPVILYFVHRMLEDKKFSSFFVISSLSYAALILTHNIMAVLFTPILLLFMIVVTMQKKIRNFTIPITFVLFSYVLSAFFWLPALIEKNNILLSTTPIADRGIYFVHLAQLILPRWGYGLPDHPDGFSYQLGLAQIIILLSVSGLLIYRRFFKKSTLQVNNSHLEMTLVVITVGAILCMFPFTAFIWRLPILKEINYPWTLLAPIGFLISLSAGFMWLQNKQMKTIAIAACFLAVVLVLPYAKPSSYVNRGDGYYLTNEATTTSSQELMPLWVKVQPGVHSAEKVALVKGEGSVQNILYNSRLITFNAFLQKESTLQIKTIFYPGWVIKVDGKALPITYDNRFGFMDITLPKGEHHIVGIFSETPLRWISDSISVLGGVILLGLIVINGLKYNRALLVKRNK